MRRAIALGLIMFGISALGEALDAYPTTSLAEDATATWCPYCPEAYAGLDVVQSRYDETEFISVRYYSTPAEAGSQPRKPTLQSRTTASPDSPP